MTRAAVKDFELGNPLYRGAEVSFYTVAAGAKTSTKATLYGGPSGTTQLANPQRLDAHGKFKQPVYIESSVIGAVDGIGIPSHDTGIATPAPDFRVNTSGELQYSFDGQVTWNNSGQFIFRERGPWATATAYKRLDLASNGGSVYYALDDHTSGATFAGDEASHWRPVVGVGSTLITGDLTVQGNTTLGDAAADTLTINSGAWTLGNNVTIARAAGTVAAGAVNLIYYSPTYTGHAGGTSDVRSIYLQGTAQGGNAFADVNPLRVESYHNGTALVAVFRAATFNTFVGSSGSVTNGRCVAASVAITGAGNVTDSATYTAGVPTMTGAGAITTQTAYAASNQGGSALIGTAIGFKAADMTLATTAMRGFVGELTSGTGKRNLYMSGNAANYLGGQLLIGHDTALSVTSTTDQLFQLASSSFSNRKTLFAYFAADSNPANLILAKSRSGSIGTFTYPQAGDFLGALQFAGASESTVTFESNGYVAGIVGSTWTAANRETYLSLAATPAASLTAAEQVRILGVASTTNLLTLAGSNGGNPTIGTTGGNVAITPALICAAAVTVAGAVATPAGGSTSARLLFGTTVGFGVYYGSGVPTVSAAQGSIYVRSDGSSTTTRAYVNTDGATTWTGVTTVA